jgi:MFS family permease
MAFVQAFAPNLACFIAGRTIQGLGVGFLSMTVPVIQTEIAAPHRVCPFTEPMHPYNTNRLHSVA